MTTTASKREHSAFQPTGQWIRKDKRLAIYLRDELRCMYCGRNLKDAAPADVTLDHLTPRSAVGTNESTNLVTACRPCNSSRGARSLEDFAPGGALLRISVQRKLAINLLLARAILNGTAGDPISESAR